MISSILSRLVILIFGTLYPAYASYKAVRTKNLKEYVKWMMYWIVFALFTCAETFTDVFLSWFPFYYEVKIVLVLWLLSPATKGSSILYRKFVHPALSRREQEIDDAIAKAKDQGYHTVLNLGSKGVNYATAVIMQTAIRGGGGLVQQLKKSYSLSDLTATLPMEREADEADDVLCETRPVRSVVRSGYNTRRSASESNNRSPLYFAEVDVDVRAARGAQHDFSHIKSSEDISSGYSSADTSKEQGLTRVGSIGGRSKTRQVTARSTVTAIKRPAAAEDSEVIVEELLDNDNIDYDTLPSLVNLPPFCHISNTNPPFIFQYVGNEVKIIKILGELLDEPDNNVTQESYNINTENDPNDTVNETSHCTNNEINNFVSVSEVVETIETKELILDNKDKSSPHVLDEENISYVTPSDTKIVSVVPITEIKQITSENNDKIPILMLDEKMVACQTPLDTNIVSKREEVESKFEENSINTECKLELLKPETKISASSSSVSLNSAKTSQSTDKDDNGDEVSMSASSINDETAETDDEGSYGTPENSPKAKKKGKKGKYGKLKAPPPPVIQYNSTEDKPTVLSLDNTGILISSNEFQMELNTEVVITEISHKSRRPVKSELSHGHISKRNYRQKSKSPIGKQTNASTISKLMQLPGKLAFWNKTDDKIKSDTISTSSSNQSRRSSAFLNTDEFQSCVDYKDKETDSSGPNENIPFIKSNDNTADNTSRRIKLVDDLEESEIAKDILDKSDALQKLIEAKLESHPEYKFVSLHGEETLSNVPHSSKSTDV